MAAASLAINGWFLKGVVGDQKELARDMKEVARDVILLKANDGAQDRRLERLEWETRSWNSEDS